MKYYRRFPGDYLRDTIHLSAAEDGMYGRLLDAHYTSELPLPLDRSVLYATVRANSSNDQEAVESVLSQFFKKTRYGFVNRRVKKEIARMKEISAKRSNAGKQKNKQPANAQQMLSKPQALQTPDSRLQTSDKEREEKTFPPAKNAGVKPTPEFLVFWGNYPRKVDKQDAVKAWIRRGCEGRLGEVLASLKAWVDVEWKGRDLEFIPHAATWLNSDCWKETPQKSTGPSLEDQLRDWEVKHGQGSKPHAN